MSARIILKSEWQQIVILFLWFFGCEEEQAEIQWNVSHLVWGSGQSGAGSEWEWDLQHGTDLTCQFLQSVPGQISRCRHRKSGRRHRWVHNWTVDSAVTRRVFWPFYKENIIIGWGFRLDSLDGRSDCSKWRMLAMMSPQVMRSVWGRRKEEKISEPGEKTTLLTSPSTENSIETISLAISDCPGDGGGGGGGGEGRGTRGRDCRQVDSEKVERRITNETD